MSFLKELFKIPKSYGKSMTFFWRDDDGWENCPGFEQLVIFSNKVGYEPNMSLIPKLLKEDFSKSLKELDYNLGIHGFEHVKAEGSMSEWDFLNYKDAFTLANLSLLEWGKHFDFKPSYFCPPWNIASEISLEAWKNAGVKIFSGHRNYPLTTPSNSKVINVAIDLNLWGTNEGRIRSFEESCIMLSPLIRNRELGLSIGLNTHHREMSSPKDWEVLHRIFDYLVTEEYIFDERALNGNR